MAKKQGGLSRIMLVEVMVLTILTQYYKSQACNEHLNSINF